MGWARVLFLDLGVNPFHSDFIFYPLGGDAVPAMGHCLARVRCRFLSSAAFGLAPAFNLMYLAASVLTGYGTYLLAKQELLRAIVFKHDASSFDSRILDGAVLGSRA